MLHVVKENDDHFEKWPPNPTKAKSGVAPYH